MVLVNQDERCPTVTLRVRRSLNHVNANRMAIPSARNDDQPKQIPRLRRKLMDRLKASSEVNDEAGIMIIPLQQISNVGSQLGNRHRHVPGDGPEPLKRHFRLVAKTRSEASSPCVPH